jgi:hypothetical protein
VEALHFHALAMAAKHAWGLHGGGREKESGARTLLLADPFFFQQTSNVSNLECNLLDLGQIAAYHGIHGTCVKSGQAHRM